MGWVTALLVGKENKTWIYNALAISKKREGKIITFGLKVTGGKVIT